MKGYLFININGNKMLQNGYLNVCVYFASQNTKFFNQVIEF